MGDIIQRKLKNYIAGAVLCILLLFFVALINLWRYEKKDVDFGLVRVMSNQLLSDLEEHVTRYNMESIKNKEYRLPYCVFDLNGKVLISSLKKYSQGDLIDLHTISDLYHYIVPINLQDGTKVILCVDSHRYQTQIAKKKIIRQLPIILLIIIVLIGILFKRHKVMKQDVWQPIHQIHQVTKDMLEGRLETSITYEYEGEIGTLCRDFESMKEEIFDGMQREVQSKEKERALYASISHDLKTPLAIITGYLEELLLGVIKEEDIQETLSRSLEKAKVLNKLIQDILEHSKAQLDQLTIKKEEVYARDFYQKLLEGYSKDASLQQYKLVYTLPDNIIVMIDSNRIAQVMQNLFDNAIKYRKKDLTIEVTFEILKEPDNVLITSVKDNSRGIEAVDQPFIFDMFYRGNKARTQNISGSGLGLNICEYIVKKHGGHIECDSIAGVGTTMSFSIPIH